jgi:hypothetical protein
MHQDIMFLANNSLHNLGGQNDHVHVIMQDICNKFIETLVWEVWFHSQILHKRKCGFIFFIIWTTLKTALQHSIVIV